MAAMNQNSWYVYLSVVICFAKLTYVFVDEFGDEPLNFFVVLVGDVFGLSEKEGGWVLEPFHFTNFKFI